MRFDEFVRRENSDDLPPVTPAKIEPKKPVQTVNVPEPKIEIEQEPLPQENPATNLATLQQNLNNCLKIINDEVMKGYLFKLDKLPIIEADENQSVGLKPIHFFRITSLVYQEDKLSVSKLSTLFKVLCNKPCTLVLMIKSDGRTNEFYLGVRLRMAENSTATMMQMLKRSMAGLFPGSRVKDYLNEDLQCDLDALKMPCLSNVTCVADFRQKVEDLTDKRFIQGMEKFIDSMNGRSYQAIFIAENVSYSELERIKHSCENICTQLSPFANMQINFSVSTTDGKSQGQSDGRTYSTSHGTGQSKTFGKSKSSTDSLNRSSGKSHSYSKSISQNDSFSENQSIGESAAEAESAANVYQSVVSGKKSGLE